MLCYRLIPNKLPNAKPGDHIARTVDAETKSRADLIHNITGPGSILKPTESNAVSDEYISIHFGFRGSFNGKEDEFDPARHRLTINRNLPKKVAEVATRVPLPKTDARPVASRGVKTPAGFPATDPEPVLFTGWRIGIKLKTKGSV